MPHHQWNQRGVKVAPRSKLQIRELANKVRGLISARDDVPLDIVSLLEIYLQELKVEIFVLDRQEMKTVEASTDSDDLKIFIRDDVYEALHNGDGRSRFTIAHEIGHLLMHENVSLARDQVPPKAYEDSEWQADVFAAELLVPLHVAAMYNDPSELSMTMGVSFTCAKNRISEARKQKSQP